MKLKIRYENEVQTIELDAEATAGLWVSLSLEEDETLSQDEKEQKLQEAFDVQFNRPDYNNWHRHNRIENIDAYPKVKRLDGKAGYINGNTDDPTFDPMEYLRYTIPEDAILDKLEYDALCAWIREVLSKKPDWAEMFIAVYMDGESIRDYAARTGNDENNITQKLKRAKKKLAQAWINRQIILSAKATK